MALTDTLSALPPVRSEALAGLVLALGLCFDGVETEPGVLPYKAFGFGEIGECEPRGVDCGSRANAPSHVDEAMRTIPSLEMNGRKKS